MKSIAATVSRSRLALSGALHNPITTALVWWVLLAVFVAATIGTIAYVVLRLRTTHDLETRVLTMQAVLDDLKQREQTIHSNLNDRLVELEVTVYGQLEPKARVAEQKLQSRVPLVLIGPTTVKQYEELKQRVTQLERWRLQEAAKER